MLRNTYVNGLENKVYIPLTSENRISNISKRILWGDKKDNSRKDLLCNINPAKELYFLREIKPILNHKKMTPIKSSIKYHGSLSSKGKKIDDYENMVNINHYKINKNYDFQGSNNNIIVNKKK